MFSLEDFRANFALEGFDVTNTMDTGQVYFQVIILCNLPAANIALEGFDVTNTMNSSHVTTHFALFLKRPAANVTLVSGVRVLWPAAALSMRRVVVSADR